MVTNNKPPFSVDVNNENNIDNNKQQVFRQIVATASPKWVTANLIKLDVQPEVLVAIKKQRDWKKLIFWVALIAAVIVLFIFSFKLFKQLKVSDVKQ